MAKPLCLLLQCYFYLQRVGFLPARDSQDEVVWVTLEDSQTLPDIDWQILTFTPPPEQDNSQYRKNKNLHFSGIQTGILAEGPEMHSWFEGEQLVV